jgi:hypothetical protein
MNMPAFTSQGYSRDQRAYLFTKQSSHEVPLEFELVASRDSPVANLVFVINKWGDAVVTLKINGKPIKRGKRFRFGHRHTIEGSDLIVWIKTESTEPIKISLTPVPVQVTQS